jgi:hypothetical protein
MAFRHAPYALSAGLAIVVFVVGACITNPGGVAPIGDAGGGTDSTTLEDSGTPFDGSLGDDSASPDEGVVVNDAAEPCALPDGGMFPAGTQLVQSSTVTAAGLTSDGYAVYTDTASSKVYALATPLLDAGTPAPIAASDGSGVQVLGAAVLAWTGANQMSSLAYGALTVWTAASGAQSIATASPGPVNGIAGWTDVSRDGHYVLYFDDASAVAQTADLYVAGTDGTGKVKLAAGVTLSTSCIPQIGFVGALAVATYCTSASGSGAEAGPAAATLATWKGSGWATGVTVSSAASPFWSRDASQTQVAYRTAAGLYAYDASTGTSALIDPAGVAGLFTSDSSTLVYTATDGSIRRATLTSPSPLVVLPGIDAGAGYAGLIALSGDGNHLLAYQNLGTSVGTSDLYFASTAPGSTAITLSSSPTAAVYGDPFTLDSTHALFLTSVDVDQVGDYSALAVTGTTPAPLGSLVWQGVATSAAKVVFNDNWVGATNTSGRADLESIDTSAAASVATKLVSAADTSFFLSSDRSQLLYSWSRCAGAQAGLYVMSAP